MARWMRCTVDAISVTVRAAEYAERIGEGKIVDFDRVLLPASGDTPAYTLEDALGHRAGTCFEPAGDQRVSTHIGLPADDTIDEPQQPADAPVRD